MEGPEAECRPVAAMVMGADSCFYDCSGDILCYND
jgi:hypothetical protein